MKPSSKRCRALALARRKTLLRTETRMVRSGRSTISVVSGVSGTRPSPDYGNTSRCPRMRFPRRKRLPTVLGRRRHPLHRRSVFHGALSSWLCWLAAESPGSFSADAVPPRMRKRLGRTFQNTLRRSRRQSRRLAISGQGCVNCAARVRNGLIPLDGVHHAEIYLESGLVEVYFDGSKITQAMLVNAVAGAGNDGRHHYKAVVVGQSFHIEPA